MKLMLVVFAFLHIVLIFIFHVDGEVSVTIPELGTYIGSTDKTLWNKRSFMQFLAVKYAKAPSGIRRFKPPELDVPKTGIHNSTVYARPCPVYEYYLELENHELQGDLEDCLILDIYTRNLTAKNAVLVYIHGGGFDKGASYRRPPHYFLEKDIVYVVPQYRLGPFGFITTNTEEIPGNLGLSDSIASLKWIKRFIHHFGGDPEKITIWGGSSSATSVSSLLFSPDVPYDLFRGVIIQSGTFFGKWAIDSDPVRTAKLLATFYNCTSVDTVESINKCLMNADVLRLLEAYSKSKALFMGARPIINKVLPYTPYDIVYKNIVPPRNISLLIGGPRDDGCVFLPDMFNILKLAMSGKNLYFLSEIIGQIFGVNDPSGTFSGYVNKILFTQDQMLEGNIEKLYLGLIDLTDALFIKGPTIQALHYQSKSFPNKTFIYSFEYAGEFANYKLENFDLFDLYQPVVHSDENVYVFPFPEEKTHLNDADKKMAMTMIDLWTSFTIDGQPSSPNTPEFPPVTNFAGPYMRINTVSTIGENYLKDLIVATESNGTSKREFYWLLCIIICLNL